jgi:CheY-like chemotaxis protein
MSHELRSPLNVILGFTQLMTKSPTIASEQQENLRIIARSGEHLLTLINQVLDLSKIEAGRTTLNETNFDLHRLLDDLEDMFQLKADERHLQLVFERNPDIPQYVRTDEVKLRQILINLLNNAIKFTQEGGVCLRVKRQKSNEETEENVSKLKLNFEIEDTGAGIAQDDLESIFEAFVQSQTGKEAQEGTGLGLPIARNFIQLMDGEITVSSEVGRGTIFKFDIGISKADTANIETKLTTRQIIALEPNQPRYRILIVDDKWSNRQLLIKLLSPLGFELKEASNGKEAIEVWDTWEPHLIWMDMRMPILDGYEATKHIKAATKGQATAIIALTASTLEEDRAIVLSAGCDDFVRKPFREADILDAMNKHIGVRYIYDEPANKLNPTQFEFDALNPATLNTLPARWVAELHQAVAAADSELAFSLIEQLEAKDTTLAKILSKLVNDFEFDRIEDWIAQSSKK